MDGMNFWWEASESCVGLWTMKSSFSRHWGGIWCTLMFCKGRVRWSVHRRGWVWNGLSLAKVLGVTISSDLKWSAHIDSITTKAAKRVYLLRQLKRAGIAPSHLVLFYCSVVRSVLEYACQVFHCNLPLYLLNEIEPIQRTSRIAHNFSCL